MLNTHRFNNANVSELPLNTALLLLFWWLWLVVDIALPFIMITITINLLLIILYLTKKKQQQLNKKKNFFLSRFFYSGNFKFKKFTTTKNLYIFFKITIIYLFNIISSLLVFGLIIFKLNIIFDY